MNTQGLCHESSYFLSEPMCCRLLFSIWFELASEQTTDRKWASKRTITHEKMLYLNLAHSLFQLVLQCLQNTSKNWRASESGLASRQEIKNVRASDLQHASNSKWLACYSTYPAWSFFFCFGDWYMIGNDQASRLARKWASAQVGEQVSEQLGEQLGDRNWEPN